LRSGQVALALGPSTLATALLGPVPSAGTVSNQIGCARLPGSPRVYERGKRVWTDAPSGSLNRAAVLEGMVASVLRSSAHRDAAFDLLASLTDRERNLAAMLAPDYGLSPYRLGQLADVRAWSAAGWSAHGVPSLLEALDQSLRDPNAVALTRVAGSAQYHAELARVMRAALAGEVSVEQGLAEVALKWREITRRRGLEGQVRQYRRSLGMPVLE
jgi:ABC-type glycerol-3-phosphate transport system substrate-binding protein